ncbi:hypothetical protein K438DRAFT_94573 [Mycena galopus ATCC 62051]|nr:hypothetical protein K438DRAFT_94573 [Mycena galopus ATCC 62051]
MAFRVDRGRGHAATGRHRPAGLILLLTAQRSGGTQRTSIGSPSPCRPNAIPYHPTLRGHASVSSLSMFCFFRDLLPSASTSIGSPSPCRSNATPYRPTLRGPHRARQSGRHRPADLVLLLTAERFRWKQFFKFVFTNASSTYPCPLHRRRVVLCFMDAKLPSVLHARSAASLHPRRDSSLFFLLKAPSSKSFNDIATILKPLSDDMRFFAVRISLTAADENGRPLIGL